MEYIEIYDGEGSPTGRIKARGEPLLAGEFVKAVGVWVFTPEGKILLTQRSPEKRFAPGKWENTGGHVERGESSAQAAVRELAEETGLKAKPEELVFLGFAKAGHYLGDNFSVRLAVNLEKIRLQPGETCGARLVSYEEFLALGKAGELAPSVTDHLSCYQEAFLSSLQHNLQARDREKG